MYISARCNTAAYHVCNAKPAAVVVFIFRFQPPISSACTQSVFALIYTNVDTHNMVNSRVLSLAVVRARSPAR